MHKPTALAAFSNILPNDGQVFYVPHFLAANLADDFTEKLHQNIPWQHDELRMFGKKITTKREVAWHGDEGVSYTYSKVAKYSLPWTEDLLTIKSLTENISHQAFNAVLLNRYPNGNVGMAWHSDDEKELNPGALIASISLGAERKFRFKHKTSGQTLTCSLAHGSLLLMDHASQLYWQHCLPKMAKVQGPRINLTFRHILRG